jgi:hypothetical protein
MTDPPAVGQIVGRVDHLVYATPDVEGTSADLERRFGVRASPGGQHPGRGTRNILIGIGSACYMEIVGPDLAQEPPSTPRWFGIDTLIEPRLVAWAAAANATDLTHVVNDAARRGVRLGEVGVGRRKRPDGVELKWQLTDPAVALGDGLVPFLIDWGASPHPSTTAVAGPTLVDLHGEHPNPERVMGTLGALGIAMRVTQAAHPSLVATLRTDAGLYELR